MVQVNHPCQAHCGTTTSKCKKQLENIVIRDSQLADCVQVATATPYGLTRGDFATPDPTNGSLLLTQSTTIMRLTPPAGGRFGQTPPAPLGLRATPGNAQVSLAWNPVPGATAYTLWRGTAPGTEQNSPPVATGITALTYTDAGLTNGQTYYYVLSAVGVFGTGPTSNEASATPDGGLPLPVNAAAFVSQGVPASMNAGQQYPVTVTMRNTGTSVWTAAGLYLLGSQADQDNRRWGLGRVELPGTPPGPVQPGATAAFTFTVTAPAAPGSYAFQWRMVQENVQWFGDFTPQVNVNVHLALAAPANLTAVATGGGNLAVEGSERRANAAAPTGGGKIALYWNGVAGATGYNVYRGTSAGGEDYAHPVNGSGPTAIPDAGPGVTNTLMFSDAGLADGTEYFYTVTAVYDAGESGPCDEDSATPDPSAVPWDTGDPAQIVPQMSYLLGGALPPDDPTDPESGGTVGMLTISGPDGVIYVGNSPDGSPPAAIPSIGTVDGESGEIDYADGTVGQLPNDGGGASNAPLTPAVASIFGSAFSPNALPAGSPPTDWYPTKGQPTGPYYKLETDPGYTQMNSTVILPGLDSSSIYLAHSTLTYPGGSPVTDPKTGQPYILSDAADVYEGGRLADFYDGGRLVGGSTMDAGVQYSPDQLYKAGWQPFIGGLQSKKYPNRSLPYLNATMVSVIDPDPRQKSAQVVGKIYVKGAAPDGLQMSFIAPGPNNIIGDKNVVLHITGNYQIFYPPSPNLSLGLLGPSGFGSLTLVGFTPDWTRTRTNTNHTKQVNQFILKRANSIAQKLYDPAKKLPVNADANYVYRPYPDGLTGEVSPTDPDLRGFRRSGSYVYGAGWGDYSGDQNSVQVFGSQIGTESGSLTNHQVFQYGSYPRRPLGYVTWYDQSEFFWQNNINLRTTR